MLVKLVDKEFRALVESGFVYILRLRRINIGRVFIYYDGRKVGRGRIECVGKIMSNNGHVDVVLRDRKVVSLENFLPHSGFSSIEEWKEDVLKRIGPIGCTWLYKLTPIAMYV